MDEDDQFFQDFRELAYTDEQVLERIREAEARGEPDDLLSVDCKTVGFEMTGRVILCTKRHL